MKITIVTISYNQARFIEKTILSVLNQNYPNLEYIIVDAGSTDGTRDIIEKYKDQILTIFEPDQGPADGLNKGFAMASGSILGFVNSDDILLSGSLEVIANVFKNKNIDAVFGNGFIIDSTGKKTRKVFADRPSSIKRKYALGIFNFIQPSFFFTKDAYNKTDGFNINNKTCWDGEFVADLALQNVNFLRIHNFLSGFRLYDSSISGSGKLNKIYFADRKRIFRKIMGREPRFYDSLIKYFFRMLNLIETPAKLSILLKQHL